MISGEAQHKEARSNSEVSNLMAIEADIAIQDELEKIVVLKGCLTSVDQILREDGDDQYIDRLSIWLSTSILPNGGSISQDEMLEGMLQCSLA